MSEDREALRLETVARRHEEALRAMAAEFRASGDPRMDLLLDDADAWFASVEWFRAGRGLPSNRVPQESYLGFVGTRLVGGIRLRKRLIPVLRRDGGHLGYEVRPSERGRGYATAMLRCGLEAARREGLSRVLLTAGEANPASVRVIEKCGGRRDGSSRATDTRELMRRYWIDL